MGKVKTKSVDDYLNNIDYKFVGYIPSEYALLFVNFIQEVNDGAEENETPIFHLVMMDKIFTPQRRCAVFVFRGASKTTLFAEYLILFIASFGYLPNFGTVNLMMYVSDSIENGVKNLRRNVEFRYENSEFLQKLIPNKALKVGTDGGGYVDMDTYEKQIATGRRLTDIRLEFANNKGHRLVVRGFGASTGVRGVKEMGKRPTLCILDDLLSDQDAKSPTVIENIENIVYKAVSKALHPTNQKIIWLGTPFNANDPLYKAVESGVWNASVFPICEKFPVTKEEFRGAWEDRFNYEYVKGEYDEAISVGRPDNFYQELMLQITSTDERLVNDSDIVWFNNSHVYKNRSNFNFYISTDFAVSKRNTSDYSVILVWAYSNKGHWMLVDGLLKKQDMSSNVKALFNFASLYNPLGVGIEVSGQQKAFISWIQSEMLSKNVYFNLLSSNNKGEAGIRPVSDKFSRFVLFVPQFKQKKIWMAEELKGTPLMNEILDELHKATSQGFRSKHDDVLDAISMVGTFDAYKPSESYSIDEEMFHDESLGGIKNTVF